jgi:hypothetical protein
MPVYSLADPDPTAPRSRFALVVKYNGHSTYAAFRNGSYEFELDDLMYARLVEGSLRASFEMVDGRPTAIVLTDQRRPGK